MIQNQRSVVALSLDVRPLRIRRAAAAAPSTGWVWSGPGAPALPSPASPWRSPLGSAPRRSARSGCSPRGRRLSPGTCRVQSGTPTGSHPRCRRCGPGTSSLQWGHGERWWWALHHANAGGHPQTPLPVPRARLCLTPAHSMASAAPGLAPHRAATEPPQPLLTHP